MAAHRDEGFFASTTVEAVARRCWERIVPSLGDEGLSSLALRVCGSPGAYVACRDLLD